MNWCCLFCMCVGNSWLIQGSDDESEGNKVWILSFRVFPKLNYKP